MVSATELCQVPGSEANGNTIQQNASEDCGIGLQSQNTGMELRRSKRMRFGGGIFKSEDFFTSF